MSPNDNNEGSSVSLSCTHFSLKLGDFSGKFFRLLHNSLFLPYFRFYISFKKIITIKTFQFFVLTNIINDLLNFAIIKILSFFQEN